MNNNDDKERWETFCKLYDKLSSKEEMRELFEEEIKCFSLYLSHVNQDYVYNATFLPQFNDDFWNFLCAFNKKYKIVEKLFDVAEKYYNVTLKIDRYWMMTVDEKGKIKKSTLTGNVIQYKSFMNLEAAHIWPRSHKGLYLPSNGIALCRDMHWAFDKGMFTIGDDFKVIVHPDVESDYLQQYNNKSLYIPENAFFRPDINNLHYHQTHIYGLFKTSGSLVKATGYYKNINMAAEDKTPYGSN